MSRADTAPDHHSFWHDPALPFIEARAVQDGRRVCYDKHSHPFSIGASPAATATTSTSAAGRRSATATWC